MHPLHAALSLSPRHHAIQASRARLTFIAAPLELPAPAPRTDARVNDVQAIVSLPDGTLLIASIHGLQRFDPEAGTRRWEIVCPFRLFRRIALTRDGRAFFESGPDLRLVRRDLETGAVIDVLREGLPPVNVLLLSPDGGRFLVGGSAVHPNPGGYNRARLAAIDLATGADLWAHEGAHFTHLAAVDLVGVDRVRMECSDGSARTFAIATGAEVPPPSGWTAGARPLEAGEGGLVWSADARWFARAAHRPEVELVDAATGSVFGAIRLPDDDLDRVSRLATLPDHRLAAGTVRGEVLGFTVEPPEDRSK
jgi:hypothetical protein